jgi:hypothetical protein
MIATLNDHFKPFAQVLRVREGVELSRIRLARTGALLEDTRQESGLRDDRLGRKPCSFPEPLQRSQKHMSSDVLFARIGQ